MKKIKVLKFGGTSVATEESRNLILNKIIKTKEEGFSPVVVVSALGRYGDPYATDTLISMLPQKEASKGSVEHDLMISCGEIITSALLSNLLNSYGYKSIPLTGFQAGIVTDSNHGYADILEVNTDRILELINQNYIVVVAGFQGVDSKGYVTTIGRGGSDTTAAVLGVALDADSIDIYTDVDGVMTADPRIVKDAEKIEKLNYSEVYQMAVDGAKVIDHKAIAIAMKGNKTLTIKNTFSDDSGTVIRNNEDYEIIDYAKEGTETKIFDGITYKKNIAQVMILSKDKDNGSNLLIELDNAGISMDMISFFTEKKVFTIRGEEVAKAKVILDKYDFNYEIRENLSKVTVVGHRIHGIPGVMKRIVISLNKNQIEILQTSDSNTTIACLIDEIDLEKALNALHTDLIV